MSRSPRAPSSASIRRRRAARSPGRRASRCSRSAHAGAATTHAARSDRAMTRATSAVLIVVLLCGSLALLGTGLCLVALRAGPVRTAAALGVFALSPVLLGSVVLTRFDLWPAALAVLALATLLWRRYVAAAVLLGLAIGAKLWPVVLLPLAIVWLVRTRGPRAASYWSGGVISVLALVFVPFAVLSPGGIAHSFDVQFARPLQLESLGGSILIAAHHLAGTTLGVATTYGSQNLLGPGTRAVALATSIAGPLALAAVWVAFARGPATSERRV